MRKTATTVLEWTADNISPANSRYLKQLPQGITVDDVFIMVHGSLVERDAYILNPQEISKNLDCMINDFDGMTVPAGMESCCDGSVPLTQKERSWSSPIWFDPNG